MTTQTPAQRQAQALLTAAIASDSRALQIAANDSIRGSRADQRDTLALVAWAAGCMARRLPDNGAQVAGELFTAQDTLARHPLGVHA